MGVFEGTVALLRSLRAAGMRVAIISASRNCVEVLKVAGLDDIFDGRVDGVVADELGLPSKPDPAVFLEAARRLRVTPSRPSWSRTHWLALQRAGEEGSGW